MLVGLGEREALELQAKAGKNYLMSFSDPEKMLSIKEKHEQFVTNWSATRMTPTER